MRNLLFFLFASIFIISCGDKSKVPDDVLPKEKMQSVLWSMISAGEFLNAYVLNKDSVDRIAESSRVYGQVFQVHHISKDEFDRSYLYYRQHPDIMKTILDSLSKKQTYTVEKLERKSDSTQNKILEIEDVK